MSRDVLHYYVGQLYTSNSISNEVAYVYLATGVELGEAHCEPTELVEIQLRVAFATFCVPVYNVSSLGV
jgi:hypothetical protein